MPLIGRAADTGATEQKRRFACIEVQCKRRSFTETSAQLPARARVRLRVKVCAAVTTTNRAVSEVAKDHGIAWGTVHRILVKAAADLLGQAAPTSMIGIDETRARSVRWIQEGVEQTSTWRRSDPWMTSIVDLYRRHLGGIIGLAAGRPGACVEGWIPGPACSRRQRALHPPPVSLAAQCRLSRWVDVNELILRLLRTVLHECPYVGRPRSAAARGSGCFPTGRRR